MDTVKERLKTFIRFSNLTIREFELKCGFSNASVNNISDSITKKKLEAISEAFPELSLEWLVFGRGEMIVSKGSVVNSTNPYTETLVTALNETISAKSALIEVLKEKLEQSDKTLEEYRAKIRRLQDEIDAAQKNARRNPSGAVGISSEQA